MAESSFIYRGRRNGRVITAILLQMHDALLFQGKHLDFISFNRYNGWYSNPGRLDMITQNVIEEATEWHEKHNKPVLISEYGADTMIGLHLVRIKKGS